MSILPACGTGATTTYLRLGIRAIPPTPRLPLPHASRQAPVVAYDLLAQLGTAQGTASYDGYGSCPLTVEMGDIVLAEFTYGGKLAPSFPPWLIDGTKPSRLAWHLKKDVLPSLYWECMLKGREWMARPQTS